VNLRTFLPPPEKVPVATPPVAGDQAPALPDGAPNGKPYVVAFLRHTGCPFAEWTAKELREAAERHPHITWIAVSHGSDEATEAWLRAVGGAGAVAVVIDRPRESYARWGLGRTSLRHFAGHRSLGQVARLARQGIRNRRPDGTRWQRAGTFAVDAGGVVRWRHLPDHAGSLPDLAQAAASAST
jgi:AhpC/TSA antioxidant enzyme